MSLNLSVKDRSGSSVGTVELSADVFGVEPNVSVMHQVVTAQLAARRAGTHATKTRAMVSGGGAKPWRQKGTGRARQGSTRAPHWTGGGVSHGPQPRSYKQRTPKKMVRLALTSALSDRAQGGNVAVINSWEFDAPKTKDAIALLEAFGFDGAQRALVVLDNDDANANKSFRNLGRRVHVIQAGELNTYDVLVNDVVIFSEKTLSATTDRLSRPVRPGAKVNEVVEAEEADPATDSDAAESGAEA
ncbi:MAG: 50S ribosomal protein L4 [Actinobacteria bacterium]|nr:50S ribosomal protein L4 [Actinomycetota bacterium]MCB9389866.1 50S ribosomal protein L4 [Acidimicrobiia bacterium]